MRKGITLLTVLLLPITIYLIFAISTIHYVPVPHYGPRTTRIVTENGHSRTDTVYHSIGAFAYRGQKGLVKSDTLRGHMYLALFVRTDSAKSVYNCAALKAYSNLNKADLDTLHFVFFYPLLKDSVKPRVNLADTLRFRKDHCLTFFIDSNDGDYLCKEYYFKPRPGEKKFPWQSLNDLVLIDTKGCIRGYYDARYAPDISRMVEDIKHIKFHDEAAGMEKKYTPVKKAVRKYFEFSVQALLIRIFF